MLEQVYEIADRHGILVMNVFHAGDGNLHPLLVFDKREPGMMEKVHAAGGEIVRVSVAAGGVLSSEHGIGLGRDLMPLMFGPADLAAAGSPALGVRHDRPRESDEGAAESGRVRRLAPPAGGSVDLTGFAAAVGPDGPVTIAGLSARGGGGRRPLCVGAVGDRVDQPTR
ncbi:MAG: FAD-linked oxidase C-terminal domain-containing protein [Ilumatobacteraceae bacterium]